MYLLAYVFFANMVNVLQARLRRAPHRVLHAHVVLRLGQSKSGINLYWNFAGATVGREDTTTLRLLVALVKWCLGKLWLFSALGFQHRTLRCEVSQTCVYNDDPTMQIIVHTIVSTVSTFIHRS